MQRRAKRSYVTEDSTFVTAPSAPRGNHRGPPLFDAHQAEAEQSRLQADSAPSGSGSGSNLPPAPGFGPLPTTPFSSSTATGYPSATGGSAYTYGAGGGGGGSYQPSWAAPSKGGFIDSALGVQAQAWLGWMSRAGRHAFAGMRDATKLMRSIDLVQSDPELQSNILKSSLINLISLLSIFVFDHFLLPPSLSGSGLSTRQLQQAQRVRFWFDWLWKYPVFGFCFWMNTSWSATISKRALTLQHPTSRQAQTSTAAPNWGNLPLWRRVFSVAPRVFTILDHFIVTTAFSYIPVIGKPLAFWYTCLLNAFYCFDFALSSKDWSFRMIARHIGDRTPYFVGFGLIPAGLCSFGPMLLGMTVFALIYPLFVIQAIQARPLPSIMDDDDPSTYEPLPSPSKDGSPLQSPSSILHPSSSSSGYMSTPSSGWPSLSPVDNHINGGGSAAAARHRRNSSAAYPGGGGGGGGSNHTFHKSGQFNFQDQDEGFFATISSWFSGGGSGSGSGHSGGVGRIPVFYIAVKLLQLSRWLERGLERRMKSSASGMGMGMGNLAGSRRMDSLKGYYGSSVGAGGGGGGSGGGISPIPSGRNSPLNGNGNGQSGGGYGSYGMGTGMGMGTPTRQAGEGGAGGGGYGNSSGMAGYGGGTGMTNRKGM